LILGDALLKKYADEDPLYFLLVSSKPRKILNEIDSIIYNCTGISNLTKEAGIVTKFHDSYEFKKCRLLKFNTNVNVDDLKSLQCIDFLCVCAYYSERYVNSEAYLILEEESLQNKVLILVQKSVDDIFFDFLQKCFNTSTVTNTMIPWKDIHYLWQSYTLQNNFPNNIIYLNHLKQLFKSKYTFNEATDAFENLTSKLLPKISCFIEFWQIHVHTDETCELEIDEVVRIYKMHTNFYIPEETMLGIINHYFPAAEIVENKYILNVATDLWTKSEDILSLLATVKNTDNVMISIDTLYAAYIKQKFKIHASKRFFKKFLETQMGDVIEMEKCLNLNLLNAKLSFFESIA
jgi:uncharacterized protein Usg